jgi:N-methylhydantoinase B/acetone carboxylase alpha subunit
VIANGGDTPRDAMEIVDYANNGKLKVDNLQVWKYDPPELEMRNNDLWGNTTGGAGGWGDPLERRPESVIDDLEQDAIAADFARTLYGVVASQSDKGAWVLDAKATEKRRAEIMAERRQRAVPAAEWWKMQRRKVVDKNFIEPVRDMYRGSVSFAKFDREYRGFWHLDNEFQF